MYTLALPLEQLSLKKASDLNPALLNNTAKPSKSVIWALFPIKRFNSRLKDLAVNG